MSEIGCCTTDDAPGLAYFRVSRWPGSFNETWRPTPVRKSYSLGYMPICYLGLVIRARELSLIGTIPTIAAWQGAVGGLEGVAVGVRVRASKSFKIAPSVKVRVNAKSTRVTPGGKGMHYMVNSKDRRTTTCSVPGGNML